jgi:hypothetical protein
VRSGEGGGEVRKIIATITIKKPPKKIYDSML